MPKDLSSLSTALQESFAQLKQIRKVIQEAEEELAEINTALADIDQLFDEIEANGTEIVQATDDMTLEYLLQKRAILNIGLEEIKEPYEIIDKRKGALLDQLTHHNEAQHEIVCDIQDKFKTIIQHINAGKILPKAIQEFLKKKSIFKSFVKYLSRGVEHALDLQQFKTAGINLLGHAVKNGLTREIKMLAALSKRADATLDESTILDTNIFSKNENIDWREATPLQVAVASGDFELTAQLLEKGVNANAVSFSGTEYYSALTVAVMFEQPKIAKLLIAHGAKPDLKLREKELIQRISPTDWQFFQSDPEKHLSKYHTRDVKTFLCESQIRVAKWAGIHLH